MLIKPKPGARLGEDDPLCHVKSVAELTSEDSVDRENYRSMSLPGRPGARDMTLLNQVRERDMQIPQTEEQPSRRKSLSNKKK
jgi:hypothetical protein